MIIAVFHVSGYLRMCDFTSRRFRRTQHGPDDDLGARANAGGRSGAARDLEFVSGFSQSRLDVLKQTSGPQ